MAAYAGPGLGILNTLVDKHGEEAYEFVQGKFNPLSSRFGKSVEQQREEENIGRQDNSDTSSKQRAARDDRRQGPRGQHRHQAELPSPERKDEYYSADDQDFDKQTRTSERVIRDYENEQYDKPHRRRRDKSRNMSYGGAGGGYDDRRPSSQGRSRYDDEGSDYDERTGQRSRASGRGYDDRRDRDYDREIIETEVYRGPPRTWERSSSFQDQDNGDYAVARYGGNDVAPYDSKRRSRSRGRREREREYEDERYDERDRDRDRDHESFKDKLNDTFDRTPQGLAAGIAGAVLGGLAGHQLSKDRRHKNRDAVIGAVIGGLAINAAEQKYRDWKEDRDEESYDDRRSRSAMR